MAYVKIIYQDSPSTATPLNAQNLNHMDDGIAENDRRLNDLAIHNAKSFNGREGDIVSANGDYDISQIAPTNGATEGQIPILTNVGTEEEPVLEFQMQDVPQTGHTIQGADGTNLAQEPTMQFADLHTSDDSVHLKTVIQAVKAVIQADYSSETEDGIYLVTDGDGATIEPASEDYVEAKASSDTMASLISKLFSEVDWDKVTDYAYLTLSDTGIAYYLASLDRIDRNNKNAIFTRANVSSGGARVFYYYLASSGQYYIAKGATAEEDHSSDSVPNGTRISLYYGNKKATVDLQTTANRCWLNNGQTVESAISDKVVLISKTQVSANDSINFTGFTNAIKKVRVIAYTSIFSAEFGSIDIDVDEFGTEGYGKYRLCYAEGTNSIYLAFNISTSGITIKSVGSTGWTGSNASIKVIGYKTY